MPENDKSLNSDLNKGGEQSNIEKGIKTEFNESYIPDFQYTPPTPPTPPPATVDNGNNSAATSTSATE